MAYTGPGDLKTYRVWGGLRGYSAAYAAPGNNPCFDLYVGGVFQATINILSTGAVDATTAVALIGGGTGKIGKLYDQTGGGNHLAQAVDGNRPVFTPNAAGLGTGQPCMTWVGGGENFSTGSNIPSTTQPWTMTAFAERTSIISTVRLVNSSGASGTIYLGYNSSANLVEFKAGTAVTASEADNAWHSLVGVGDDAGGLHHSIIGVDGSSTTGLNAGTDAATGAFQLSINGALNFVGGLTQLGYSELGFSTSDITALNTNDQYWFASLPTASLPGGLRTGSGSIRRVTRVINY